MAKMGEEANKVRMASLVEKDKLVKTANTAKVSKNA